MTNSLEEKDKKEKEEENKSILIPEMGLMMATMLEQ
jgi:hypothetical protein